MLSYCICVTCVIFITAVFVAFARDCDSTNTEFLSDYGWKVTPKSTEYEKITLPSYPDEVFLKYNELQKQAGLDLTPYLGMKAERFTYRVENYPYPESNEVRANVLCVNQKPVGGDIMTVALDGFMHSLLYPEK